MRDNLTRQLQLAPLLRELGAANLYLYQKNAAQVWEGLGPAGAHDLAHRSALLLHQLLALLEENEQTSGKYRARHYRHIAGFK